MNTRTSLDDQLAKLASDIDPPRDLWPGVVRGIVRTPRTAPRLASAPWISYAASAAALCLAAALIWVTMDGRSAHTAGRSVVAGVPSSADPAEGRVSSTGVASSQGLEAAFGEPTDPHYIAARVDLERTFNQRLKQLDPVTRTKIEADLAAIRKARDDISKALAAQPDCPLLEQLLASALHDEFDLYDDVVRTTQPTSARI